ncbi:MAG: PAS domain-containing protein [Verrucomicrobiota bacterium]|jgi:PAS domain S-box-containing protein
MNSEDSRISSLPEPSPAVRELRALYHSLVTQLPIGIFQKDAQGRYALVNPGFCRLKGMSAEDFLGKTPLEVARGQAAQQDAAGLATKYAAEGEDHHKLIMQTGKSIELDEEYMLADGTKRFMHVMKLPVLDSNGKVIGTQGVQFDITERKRAEAELLKTNRALQLISLFNEELVRATDEKALLQAVCDLAVQRGGYRLAWVGFAEQDEAKSVRPVASSGLSDGYLDTGNITWAETERGGGPTGRAIRTGQTAIARNIATDFASGLWRQAAIKRGYVSTIALPLQGGGRCIGALMLYAAEPDAFTPQEVILLGELAGDLAYGIGALRHRAEREKAEAEVERTAQEWQTTFDATNDAIWILDKDQRVLRSNKTADQIFHRPGSQMLGQRCWTIVHGSAEPIPDCPFARAQKSGRRETMELQAGKRWLEITVDPIRDAAGQPAGAVHIVSDITERRRLEEELIEAQKAHVIGSLAGGVAHDFNNIMSIIMSYNDLIASGLGQDSPLRVYSDEVQHAAERAAGLTRQLLIFSRKQKVQPVVLDLNHLLKDLDKMLRRLIDEHIEMTMIPGNKIGRVKADSGYVGQVLMNLVVNARDAMPNGGKLTIATNNVTLDEGCARAQAGAMAGDFVMLSVSDTGTGMTDEVKAHLFEAFFTTKPKGKGTGLGLATCQTIVQESGGHIGVESEVGRGTTFRVYFPRVEQPLEVAARPVQAGPLPRGKETLLVVEDEPAVRHLALRVLKAQGYEVLTASNGQEALHLASDHKGAPIRLVITDVVMPLMGGKVMADWLKITYPDLRILFTSGYPDNVMNQQGALEPAVAFLPKPYAPTVLVHKVREMLDAK